MKETICTAEDVLSMLDVLLKEQSRFNWDKFYSDREKPVPFFVDAPDENLAEHFAHNRLKPGKVLELGCGPGRNAIYLAQKGCEVDAVDLSTEALEWATERAKQKNAPIRFIHRNIFELELEEGAYDLVYDSGCFHHIPPHRRMNYLELLNRALKPSGFFGITCFMADGEFEGTRISDWDVYRLRSMKGGLGYTEEKLKAIFRNFEAIEIRPMREVAEPNDVFGVSFLLTALFRKFDNERGNDT